jgi:hypothetical protein
MKVDAAEMANITAKKSGDCWTAKPTNGYSFSALSQMVLPEVGSQGKLSGATVLATVDQAFQNDVKIHEDWHRKIHKAYMDRVFGALEQWSKNYVSKSFKTEAKAKSMAQADLRMALSKAKEKADNYLKDREINHKHSNLQQVGTTFKSILPDWGAQAFNVVNAYTVNFKVTDGDCQ